MQSASPRFCARLSFPAWKGLRGSACESPPGFPAKAVRWLVMIHLVCFGWLLFRADSMFQVWMFLKAMATDFSVSARAWGHLLAIVLLCFPLWFVEGMQEKQGDLEAPLRLPVPLKAALIALIVVMIVGFGNTGTQQFIYFQF